MNISEENTRQWISNVTSHVLHDIRCKFSPHQFTVDHNRYLVHVETSYFLVNGEIRAETKYSYHSQRRGINKFRLVFTWKFITVFESSATCFCPKPQQSTPHPPTLNVPDILASSNQEDNMSIYTIVNTYKILHADHLADLRVNGKIIFKSI